MGRTGLENAFSSNALALCAKADAAEDGAICKLKDSIDNLVFILDEGSSNGWCGEAVLVVGSGASEDGPDGVYFEGGVGERHGGQRLKGMDWIGGGCMRASMLDSSSSLGRSEVQGGDRVKRKRKRTSVYPPDMKTLKFITYGQMKMEILPEISFSLPDLATPPCVPQRLTLCHSRPLPEASIHSLPRPTNGPASLCHPHLTQNRILHLEPWLLHITSFTVARREYITLITHSPDLIALLRLALAWLSPTPSTSSSPAEP